MNTKTTRRAALGLALATFSATPLFAAVSSDYDHHVDFRGYRTFSFYKVQASDPLFDQRIKDEVTRDLTKAGLEMVQSGGDLAVTAIGNTHDEQEYNTFYNGLGGGGFGWGGWGGWGGRGWGGGGFGGGDATTTVQRVPVGTLLLDMYDTRTHQLVWRGRSEDQLSTKPDKNASKLNKDIDHMLNGFPPRVKS